MAHPPAGPLCTPPGAPSLPRTFSRLAQCLHTCSPCLWTQARTCVRRPLTRSEQRRGQSQGPQGPRLTVEGLTVTRNVTAAWAEPGAVGPLGHGQGQLHSRRKAAKHLPIFSPSRGARPPPAPLPAAWGPGTVEGTITLGTGLFVYVSCRGEGLSGIRKAPEPGGGKGERGSSVGPEWGCCARRHAVPV